MVVIGLLDIPPEVQLQIAEFLEGCSALNALSVTSRSLRGIAQSVLFESVRIDLEKGPWDSIGDLLANPRICAAIRSLTLHAWCPAKRADPPRNNEEKLLLVKELLPKMVGLREVVIYGVHLSSMFMDGFLEMAAKIPLKRVRLCANTIPPGVCATPNAPLRIPDLHLASNYGNLATNLYLPMLCASSATLTTLSIQVKGDVLMVLGGIELPLLHNLSLSLVRENEMSGVGAADFIAAQRAVKKLYVGWDVGPLPPGTLPNLQELDASIDLVKQLVPGRPVEEITIYPSLTGNNEDWWWEEIVKSTAVVRKLYLDAGVGNGILNIGMVEQMVTRFPFLEILGLSLHDDVRWLLSLLHFDSFFLLQTLLDIVEVLTSLKHLMQLRITLYGRNSEIRVNRDITSAIATNLRKGNSCFSTIVIWEMDRCRNTDFAWSEEFGVFHRVR
jgi:hypothetical protein